MNSWQQILAAYPLIQTIWDALAVIAPLAFLFAYSGIFFISATAKIAAIATKRSAYGKCSAQLGMLGLIIGYILVIGGRVWLYYTQGSRPEDSLATFTLEMGWMLLSIGVLLSSIYFCLRNMLKNMPLLLTTIGMISAAQNCIALVIILFAIRVASAAITPEQSSLALPDLFPNNWDAPVWSALCYAMPLTLGMAGAAAACWLPMRRKKDDYGRDYYNHMIPWCAGWARNSWLILWLLLLVSTGLQIWPEIERGNIQEAILDNIRLLLWILPPVCWTIVRHGAVPVRRTWLSFAAIIIASLFMLPYYLQLAGL